MLWNANDGRYVGSVDGKSKVLAFSPDQKLLFIRNGLWNADIRGGSGSNQPIGILAPGSGSSAAFSADSKYLATSGADGTYRVWLVDLSGFHAGAAYDRGTLRKAICLTTACPE